MAKSSKQSKNRLSVPHKKIAIVLSCVVSAVIILFVILMLYLNSLLQISSPDKAKYRMQQYLSSKYSEDFNINSPKYENGGFGIIGSWKSEAYPISNKQSKYEDNKTKDEGFLYRLIIDAPNDSQKASYVFKIVERLRQEGVYSVDVDVNRNNNSKIRCEVFFNKNKLGNKDDIESCIVKTGE